MIPQNNPSLSILQTLSDTHGFLFEVLQTSDEVTMSLMLQHELLRRFRQEERGIFLPSFGSAMALALRLANVTAEDAVFYPLNGSCVGAELCLSTGARVTFVDVEGAGLGISPNALKEALLAVKREHPPRRNILILRNFNGIRSDYAELRLPIEEESMLVIEDARDNQRINSAIDSPFFEGYRIVSAGEFSEGLGGAGVLLICPNEDRYANAGELLKRLERANQADYFFPSLTPELGYSTLQLIRAYDESERLPAKSAQRALVLEAYKDGLSPVWGLDLWESAFLSPSDAVPLRVVLSVDSSLLNFSKSELVAYLQERGACAMPFPKPLHLEQRFREVKCFFTGISEAWYENGIFLPCGSGLGISHVRNICDMMNAFVLKYN